MDITWGESGDIGILFFLTKEEILEMKLSFEK